MKFVTIFLSLRSLTWAAIASFILVGCANPPTPEKSEKEPVARPQQTVTPASPAEIADLADQISRAPNVTIISLNEKFKSIPKTLLGRYKGPLNDDAIKAWTTDVEAQIFKAWCGNNYKKETFNSINPSELLIFYRLADSPLPSDRFFQNYYTKMLEVAQKTGAPYIYYKNDYRDRHIECSFTKNHQDYKARLTVLDSALVDFSNSSNTRKTGSLVMSLTGRKVEKPRSVYIMLQTEEQVYQSNLKLRPFTEKLDANANIIVQRKLDAQTKADWKILLQSLNKNFENLLKRNEKDGYFRRYVKNSATIEREIPVNDQNKLVVTGEYKSQQSTEIGMTNAGKICDGNPSDHCANERKRIYKGSNITALRYDAYFSKHQDGGVALEALCNISGRDKDKNPSPADERYCFDTHRLIK